MEIRIRFVERIFPRLVSILTSAFVSNRKNYRSIEKSKRYFRSSPGTLLPYFPSNPISRNSDPSPLPSPLQIAFHLAQPFRQSRRIDLRYQRREQVREERNFRFLFPSSPPGNFQRAKPRSAAQFYVIPYFADTSGSGGLAR